MSRCAHWFCTAHKLQFQLFTDSLFLSAISQLHFVGISIITPHNATSFFILYSLVVFTGTFFAQAAVIDYHYVHSFCYTIPVCHAKLSFPFSPSIPSNQKFPRHNRHFRCFRVASEHYLKNQHRLFFLQLVWVFMFCRSPHPVVIYLFVYFFPPSSSYAIILFGYKHSFLHRSNSHEIYAIGFIFFLLLIVLYFFSALLFFHRESF